MSQNKAHYKPREKAAHLRSSGNSAHKVSVWRRGSAHGAARHYTAHCCTRIPVTQKLLFQYKYACATGNTCSHLRGETSKTRGSQNSFLTFFIQNLTKPIHYQGYRSKRRPLVRIFTFFHDWILASENQSSD